MCLDIAKNALDTVLMKILMLSVGDQVSQQGGVSNRFPCVVNIDRSPIGLTGDRAVGFQQVAVELLVSGMVVGLA